MGGERGRQPLSVEDKTHYAKIVVALNETIRLMQEIDQVIEEHSGWPGAFAASADAAPCNGTSSTTSPSRSKK